MTDGQKFFSGVSLLFLGLLILSDPIPSLLFFALIPISLVLALAYRLSLKTVTQSNHSMVSAEADHPEGQIVAVRIEHCRKLVTVTATWISSGVICAYLAFVLKFGIGADWLPLVRAKSIPKGDPLRGYAMMDGIFLIAGFLFLSGLIWLPMYYFFEGLAAKQKIATILKRGETHA
jgi:hypothetical protein